MSTDYLSLRILSPLERNARLRRQFVAESLSEHPRRHKAVDCVVGFWLGDRKTNPVFWFMMQLAMFAEFTTAYPINWWVLKSGVKERM